MPIVIRQIGFFLSDAVGVDVDADGVVSEDMFGRD